MAIRELPKDVGVKDPLLARSLREIADRINRTVKIVGHDKIRLGPNAEIVWSDGVITIQVDDGAAQVLEMFSSGIVSLPSQSGARVYRSSADQDMPNAETVVQFDGEDWDVNGEYNVGTYRFVAEEAGYYLVNLQVRFAEAFADQDYTHLKIRKNGTMAALHEARLAVATVASGNMATVIYLDGASDYIDVALAHDYAGGNRLLDNDKRYTYLEIIKVA